MLGFAHACRGLLTLLLTVLLVQSPWGGDSAKPAAPPPLLAVEHMSHIGLQLTCVLKYCLMPRFDTGALAELVTLDSAHCLTTCWVAACLCIQAMAETTAPLPLCASSFCSLLSRHLWFTVSGDSSALLLLQDKREKQDKLAESNLYIKNLDDSQTDDKLRQLFEVGHPLPFIASA